jgi:hypothetical protein
MERDGKPVSALGRLKASREQQHKSLSNNAAAASHIKNDSYMNTFHRALLENLEEISTESRRAPVEGAASQTARLPAARDTEAARSSQSSSPREYSSMFPPRVVHGWISGPVNEAGVTLPYYCSPRRAHCNFMNAAL